MGCVTTSFIFLVLFTLVEYHECGRFGGSRGRSGGGGYRPSGHSPPSYRPPAYHPPSNPIYRPRPSPPPYRATTARSVIFNTRMTSRTAQHVISTPRNNIHAATTPRNNIHAATTPRNYIQAATTPRPIYTRTTPRPYFSTRRPYVVTTPRRYTTARPSLPPYPGRSPVGPPIYNHPSSSGYPNGPRKITIKNKYEYHYPGHYSLPVHYSYPGYVYTPSYYSYGVHDTGSTALGFFLGYNLGRLTTPTYAHYSHYDGYTPRYDHYTVHHYYHNRESIPQQQEIRSNNIVGCVGDSTSVCPSNTVSLCTSTGALMCVVTTAATQPCPDNNQLTCIKSTISCVNNSAPECKNSNQNVTTVNIPCISNAKIYGDVKYVNNTIVTANATSVGTNGTNTALAATSSNKTTDVEYSTKYPITTTPVIGPQPVPNNISSRRRRDTPHDFCVTIVALPAKRQPTEGELFLQDAKDIFEAFLTNTWDL